MMLQFGDSLGEVALMVVVNVGQAGDAVGRLFTFQPAILQFSPDHVADGLRAIGVAAVANQAIESLGERFIERDGEAFNGERGWLMGRQWRGHQSLAGGTGS